MKRMLLDVEKEQIQDSSKNEYRFYMEHSTTAKGHYCLHFTFRTMEIAEEIFYTMKDELKLPVELLENRIILSPAKTGMLGVSSVASRQNLFNGYEMMTIVFSKQEHSKYFHEFIKDNMHNSLMSVLLRHSNLSIGFPKTHLLKPKFSLENRINLNNAFKANFPWCCALYLAFNTKLPTEIIPLELLIFITELKINLPVYNIEINREFSLAKQNVSLPFEKTLCQISAEYDQAGLFNPTLFITCVDYETASILADLIVKYTSLKIEIFDNEIAIAPCSQGRSVNSYLVAFGAVFNKESNKLYIDFKNENEANLFDMLIELTNLDIQPKLDRSKLEFEVNILPIHVPQAALTQIVLNEDEDMILSSPLYKG